MGAGGKTRRDVLTEFRVGEILAAARKIFAEHGFAGATLDLVAAEAGIAKGTLYLYFSSKEEIFWTAIRSRLSELLDRMEAAIAAETTAKAKIRASLRERYARLRADEAFLRMYFTEFGQLCWRHKGPVQEEFRDLYLRGARLLATVIEAGIASGEIRPVPALETAMAMIDLTRETFALSILGMHEHAFDQEQFVFDLFWSGITNRAQTGEGDEA